jgi:hypothetical protein
MMAEAAEAGSSAEAQPTPACRQTGGYPVAQFMLTKTSGFIYLRVQGLF